MVEFFRWLPVLTMVGSVAGTAAAALAVAKWKSARDDKDREADRARAEKARDELLAEMAELKGEVSDLNRELANNTVLTARLDERLKHVEQQLKGRT